MPAVDVMSDDMTDRRSLLLSFEDDPDVARRCEELGYYGIWTIEGQGMASFGRLTRFAMVTDELRLGTSIVNVFSRTPAALAQEIATLDRHSDGRAILGLGVAHPGVVEEFHGMPFDRPLARLREYVELIRRYVAGVDDPDDGEVYSPGRTSVWDALELPREEIPIYNAAIGPKNIELAGEVADGWLPYLVPGNRYEAAHDHLVAGAERAGRSVDDIDHGMLVLAAVSDDRERAREAVRQTVATYFRDIPGYYTRVARTSGFGDDVEAAPAAPSTEAAAECISEAFVDHVAVAGTPEEARERLDEFRSLGVTHPLLFPAPQLTADELDGMLEALAP